MSDFARTVADHFDSRIAGGDYDRDGMHTKLAERLVAVADPQPGERVLDAATGTGLAAVAAARRVGPTGRVVGIDLSPGMLARATAVAASPNVELIEGDAAAPRWPADSFDLVLCCSALPYFPDQPAALRTWAAVLAPGGRLAFNCWSEASYVFGRLLDDVARAHDIHLPVTGRPTGTPDRIRGLLAGNGFPRAEITADADGRFVPLDEIIGSWDGWLSKSLFRPRDPAEAQRLLGLKDEFRAAAERAATPQGVWDERVAYFVIGRKG